MPADLPATSMATSKRPSRTSEQTDAATHPRTAGIIGTAKLALAKRPHWGSQPRSDPSSGGAPVVTLGRRGGGRALDDPDRERRHGYAIRPTVARPSASKKCQSNGLPHFAFLDSTARGRALLAVVFFGLELAGIAWGQWTPDHALGFQMFNESSWLTIHLFREVEHRGRRVLIQLPDGHWQAPDQSGQMRAHAWNDRVRARALPLNMLERPMPASYGTSAQLFRLQAALDDVVDHLATDTQTRALVAKVDTLKNGRPGQVELRADKP